MKLNKVHTNYLYLLLIQGTNSLIPVIMLYYLSKIIGPDKFGELNFSQSFVNYFILIVSFGFDLTATREISDVNSDKNEIFNNVIYSKAVLFIFSSLFFLTIIIYFDKFNINLKLHIATYLGVVGLLLFPTWYFQGIQNLKLLSIFNGVIKLMLALCAYLFIHKENEFWLFNFFLSISQIVVGIFSFFYAIKKFDLKMKIPDLSKILKTLRNSLTFFLTIAVINLYTTSNTFIIGIFKKTYDVGLFSAALKIENIFQTLFISMISQALFPAIGALISQNYEQGLKIWKKSSFIIITLNCFISIFLFSFSNEIISLFYGSYYIDSVKALKVLSFLPVIISISSVFGIQLMINLKHDRQYFIFTLIGASCGILLTTLFIQQSSYLLVCFSWVLTESIISILCIFFVINKKYL